MVGIFLNVDDSGIVRYGNKDWENMSIWKKPGRLFGIETPFVFLILVGFAFIGGLTTSFLMAIFSTLLWGVIFYFVWSNYHN